MRQDMNFDQYLDCRNLTCPMPALQTKKALSKLSPGQVLKMASTDPGFISDMRTWSTRTGTSILKTEVEGNAHVFFIQKN